MKLYGTLFSNNVRRAYAVALHLGLPIEHIDIAPRSPAANADDFRALSPGGRVPAFSDGEFSTDESHAIMLYLAEAKPVMRWMSWSLAHWKPGWQPLQFERFVKPVLLKGQTDEQVIAQALPIFHAEAKILNAHLSGRQWLVGTDITLADFSVAAGLCYSGPAQLPLDNYSDIRAWYARVAALPAWQQSAPPAAP
jgi:glutathione S-transferase